MQPTERPAGDRLAKSCCCCTNNPRRGATHRTPLAAEEASDAQRRRGGGAESRRDRRDKRSAIICRERASLPASVSEGKGERLGAVTSVSDLGPSSDACFYRPPPLPLD